MTFDVNKNSSGFQETMEGRVIVVTGASSGLGYETVKALANQLEEERVTVVLACRSLTIARSTADQLFKDVRGSHFEMVSFDQDD